MTSLPRERLRRLVAFPLVAFYALVLVVAAWPRQLNPRGALDVPQLGANFVLAELGWPAGMAVFTGQDERELATVRSCFRLVGVSATGEGRVLYDTMAACRDGRRTVLKDPYDLYLTHTLTRALDALRGRGPHDRNTYPLADLFAIADHYCHEDGASFDRVLVTARYQARRLRDGAPLDVTIDEGAHHCAEGAWEPLRLSRVK
jgi:hypothetical protein